MCRGFSKEMFLKSLYSVQEIREFKNSFIILDSYVRAVTWPVILNEMRVDFVLILTSMLFLSKWQQISISTA